jgi:hypothetical protein
LTKVHKDIIINLQGQKENTMIKATYKDSEGFTYKSKRSKSSEVKRSFVNTVQIKSNPVQETSSHITFKNDKYVVSYNKSTQVLTVSNIVSRAFNKYNKEMTIQVFRDVMSDVTVENIQSFV